MELSFACAAPLPLASTVSRSSCLTLVAGVSPRSLSLSLLKGVLLCLLIGVDVRTNLGGGAPSILLIVLGARNGVVDDDRIAADASGNVQAEFTSLCSFEGLGDWSPVRLCATAGTASGETTPTAPGSGDKAFRP